MIYSFLCVFHIRSCFNETAPTVFLFKNLSCSCLPCHPFIHEDVDNEEGCTALYSSVVLQKFIIQIYYENNYLGRKQSVRPRNDLVSNFLVFSTKLLNHEASTISQWRQSYSISSCFTARCISCHLQPTKITYCAALNSGYGRKTK